MLHHPRRHPYAPLPCPDRLRGRGGRAVWARHSPERPESLRVTTPPRDEPCAPPPGLPRTPWRLAAALSRSMGLARKPRTCRGQTGPRHGFHQCGIKPTGSDTVSPDITDGVSLVQTINIYRTIQPTRAIFWACRRPTTLPHWSA